MHEAKYAKWETQVPSLLAASALFSCEHGRSLFAEGLHALLMIIRKYQDALAQALKIPPCMHVGVET